MPNHHNDDSQDDQEVAAKGKPAPGSSPPRPSSIPNRAGSHVEASSQIDPATGERLKESATSHGSRDLEMRQDRGRRGVAGSLVLVLIAATVTLTAGLWAWRLASGVFSPAPRLPSPGTIVVATETATGEAMEAVEVNLLYNASIGQQTTSLMLALTQTVSSAAAQSNPPDLLVFLCGPIAQDPHFVDNRQTSITWHRPNLEHGDIESNFGRVSECIYTPIKLTSSSPGDRICQALLLGTSGAPPSQVSGDQVLYVWPGVVTMPAIPIGDLNPAPVPTGSTMTASITETPVDLQNVTASPQLPDSGRLRWTANFRTREPPPREFRLSGQLHDRQTKGQRQLFLAGALIGVAGGGLVWLIESLVVMIVSPARRSP
jgi:hypothetical protein